MPNLLFIYLIQKQSVLNSILSNEFISVVEASCSQHKMASESTWRKPLWHHLWSCSKAYSIIIWAFAQPESPLVTLFFFFPFAVFIKILLRAWVTGSFSTVYIGTLTMSRKTINMFLYYLSKNQLQACVEYSTRVSQIAHMESFHIKSRDFYFLYMHAFIPLCPWENDWGKLDYFWILRCLCKEDVNALSFLNVKIWQ